MSRFGIGVVCSLQDWDGSSFLSIWIGLSILSLIFLVIFSSACFYFLYYYPTFASWRYKINPQYPSPLKVREEVIVMLRGIGFSTFCPALSLWCVKQKLGHAYCGISESTGGIGWLAQSFIIVWIFTDVYEFLYHWLGHVTRSMWQLHKVHHHFYNPTPFAVIADDPIDQFFRAAPLLFLPYFMPVNIDMIFTMFSVLFYFNGLVQHSGFEVPWLETIGIDGHSRLILTSYHHYLHHAKSTLYKPLYNGQLLQVWDHLVGSSAQPKTIDEMLTTKSNGHGCSIKTLPCSFADIMDGVEVCCCSKCSRAAGLRDVESWNKIVKPDYSVLLTLPFWLAADSQDSATKSM